jgi:hypothetical protein
VRGFVSRLLPYKSADMKFLQALWKPRTKQMYSKHQKAINQYKNGKNTVPTNLSLHQISWASTSLMLERELILYVDSSDVSNESEVSSTGIR